MSEIINALWQAHWTSTSFDQTKSLIVLTTVRAYVHHTRKYKFSLKAAPLTRIPAAGRSVRLQEIEFTRVPSHPFRKSVTKALIKGYERVKRLNIYVSKEKKLISTARALPLLPYL